MQKITATKLVFLMYLSRHCIFAYMYGFMSLLHTNFDFLIDMFIYESFAFSDIPSPMKHMLVSGRIWADTYNQFQMPLCLWEMGVLKLLLCW